MRGHSDTSKISATENGHRVLYATFDAYPGFKGAQAHIRANLSALNSRGARIRLVCLGDGSSFRDPHSGAEVSTFRSKEANLLRRSELFAIHVRETADRMLADPPTVVHFRDIWSGIPLLSHPISRTARTIFEVNGLPSIELPHHAPGLLNNTELLTRLRRMEQECLRRADRIITVSRKTADFLQERDVQASKICIIPNTAGHNYSKSAAVRLEPETVGAPESGGSKKLLYAGTLAPWQGVDTILRALRHLQHRSDLHLVLAASSRKWTGRIRSQLDQLQLNNLVTLHIGTDHEAMAGMYAGAYLSLAPLARCARNERQGCCPLKIVESMACSTPVIASNLPAIRELIRHGDDGWLIPPDSPRALAGALTTLLDDQALRDKLSLAAFHTAERQFSPGRFSDNLNNLYAALADRHNGHDNVITQHNITFQQEVIHERMYL